MEFKVLNDALHKYGPPLSPSTPMSAGIDLRNMEGINLPICPGEIIPLRSGLAIHLNDPSLAAIILPRSGIGNRGLVLANTVGLIDADYQGEIICTMYNRGEEWVTLEYGERIAQMVFIPVATARVVSELALVDEFSVTTKRGEGGHGSTGRL